MLVFLGLFRQIGVKGRPFVGTTPYIESATVALYNLTTNRQANARSIVLVSSMQALEDFEHAVGIALVESNPIIRHFQSEARTIRNGRIGIG